MIRPEGGSSFGVGCADRILIRRTGKHSPRNLLLVLPDVADGYEQHHKNRDHEIAHDEKSHRRFIVVEESADKTSVANTPRCVQTAGRHFSDLECLHVSVRVIDVRTGPEETFLREDNLASTLMRRSLCAGQKGCCAKMLRDGLDNCSS